MMLAVHAVFIKNALLELSRKVVLQRLLLETCSSLVNFNLVCCLRHPFTYLTMDSSRL